MVKYIPIEYRDDRKEYRRSKPSESLGQRLRAWTGVQRESASGSEAAANPKR